MMLKGEVLQARTSGHASLYCTSILSEHSTDLTALKAAVSRGPHNHNAF